MSGQLGMKTSFRIPLLPSFTSVQRSLYFIFGVYPAVASASVHFGMCPKASFLAGVWLEESEDSHPRLAWEG